MRLTRRDRQVLGAVADYRILRREQIQQLFFPSRNTANERLKRLYQHGFLDRHWLPVVLGQGMGQAMYTLTEQGRQLVAQQRGVEPKDIPRRPVRQRSSLFLAHVLDVNQVRIVFTLATHRLRYTVEQWVTEKDLRSRMVGAQIVPSTGNQRARRVLPDAYFILRLGDRRASFCLEMDRATETRRRWKHKVQAYLAYVQSGAYTRQFQARSLRILTITQGAKRLAHLKQATEQVGDTSLFWFGQLAQLTPKTVLTEPIWQVAGQEGLRRLVDTSKPEIVRRDLP
jgi:DNA-binding PadR family transcriptional regulator